MTTSSLAADLTGCRDTQWLDLLAACQGLPEQIAALCRASIVCVLGEPHPAGCLAQPGKFIGSVFVGRHLVVRNALLRREPAAVNTRGVVGAGAGRSSVDSVDGSPLPSGADTALAGHAG